MPQNILLNLIEEIQSWDQLEKRIADLPTEQQGGTLLRNFAKPFSSLILFLSSRKSIVRRKYHPQSENAWDIQAFKTLA